MNRGRVPISDAIADARPPLVVAGGAGHAAVVIDILRAAGRFEVIGCTAAAPDPTASVLGVPVLGGDDLLDGIRRSGIAHAIVAVGDNRLRVRIAASLRALGFVLVNAVHPAAVVAPSARLGDGVAVMAGAVVNPRCVVGDLAIVNTRAGIDHDCVIGGAAHVAPGATLAGSVQLGEGVFVGAGATIAPDVRVGDWTVVGAGSLVLRDIGAGARAFGVPARPRPGGS